MNPIDLMLLESSILYLQAELKFLPQGSIEHFEKEFKKQLEIVAKLRTVEDKKILPPLHNNKGFDLLG